MKLEGRISYKLSRSYRYRHSELCDNIHHVYLQPLSPLDQGQTVLFCHKPNNVANMYVEQRDVHAQA